MTPDLRGHETPILKWFSQIKQNKTLLVLCHLLHHILVIFHLLESIYLCLWLKLRAPLNLNWNFKSTKTVPAVTTIYWAVGGSTCDDPLLNLAPSTLFPDTIKYMLTASVIHMYVVYSRSVYIFVICCVVHFDRWQEKSYNIWQVQVQSQKYKYQWFCYLWHGDTKKTLLANGEPLIVKMLIEIYDSQGVTLGTFSILTTLFPTANLLSWI